MLNLEPFTGLSPYYACLYFELCIGGALKMQYGYKRKINATSLRV